MLIAYIQLSGKPRLMFRDIHGAALAQAERDFRNVWIDRDTRNEMKDAAR